MSTATQSKPATYSLDPTHSSVGFAVKYMGISTFRSGFTEFDAKLEVGEAGPERLSGSAIVESIELEDENQKSHVLSPDFFDAENHRAIEFEADHIELDGETAVFHGQISIRGVTRPVVAEGEITQVAEDPDGNSRYGIRLEAKVDRREFGLNWNEALPKGGFLLGNEVRLSAELNLIGEGA